MRRAEISSRVPQRIKGGSNTSLVFFQRSILLDDHLRQLKHSAIKRGRRIELPVQSRYEVRTTYTLEAKHSGYGCRDTQVLKCGQVEWQDFEDPLVKCQAEKEQARPQKLKIIDSNRIRRNLTDQDT
jgi:hypothetical protein